ncbi:MAG: polysaccharide pyruvyl transferase family protein [Terrimicrobiaceae bacterium]
MNVGILTFHWNYNYGGILQAYCLLRYLRKLGHRATFLSYKPERLYTRQRTILGLGIRSWSRSVERVLKMEAFRRCKFPVSACLEDNSSDLRLKSIDAVVVGSDVVWSHACETRWPNRFFLEGVRENEIRKIAYAPSIGSKVDLIKSVSVAQLQHAAELLAAFDSLSVRDTFSAEFVDEQIGTYPKIVCDPVMLDDVIPLRSNPIRTPKRYILCYLFEPWKAEGMVDYIQGLFGLPVVTIFARQAVGIPLRDQIVYGASLEEWLYLFENAEYVVTDSFHGTILSVHYRRPFVCLVGESASSTKSSDLLERIGLKDRIIQYDQAMFTDPDSCVSEIFNCEVEERIKSYRRSSQEFLLRSLS